MKSFEIIGVFKIYKDNFKWTINLKSFEIYKKWSNRIFKNPMNYKLEKFWNLGENYTATIRLIWTINLKSFEIQ